jgi:glycosyltransferase involved in cell wall biosynthesis
LKGEPLKELFYDSQIFAMPSLREPFGIVFLEAMWSKAVCIGTSIEAIPEIIKDGETGYIVDPNDDGALAERISALFSHPEDLKDKAERGYAVAKSEWRWDLTAKKILDKAVEPTRENSDRAAGLIHATANRATFMGS